MDTLKTWINESLPLKIFQIREGQLCMSYARDGNRYNEGEVLTNQIFEPTGPRQLKSSCAQIIRHILFTNPRLGLCSFPDIFACMFLLVSGQAATEKEIPSASIIRSHMTKLNNYNLHYQRQACVALANDLSPCGNSRKCGYVTDDTKHGSNNKWHVMFIPCDKLWHSLENCRSLDIRERYAINPYCVLGITAPAVKADWDDNSDLNIEILAKIIQQKPLVFTVAMDLTIPMMHWKRVKQLGRNIWTSWEIIIYTKKQ